MKPLARQLLDEAPIDTGDYGDYVHPQRKQQFAQKRHHLANNPSMPQGFTPPAGHKATNFEEFIGTKRYQTIMTQLGRYAQRLGVQVPRNLMDISRLMLSVYGEIVDIEEPNKERLEALALKLIEALPQFKALQPAIRSGQIIPDPQLGDADLSQADFDSPEVGSEAEVEFADPQTPEEAEELAGKLENFDLEVAKRTFMNALIHGASASNNYAFELINDELSAINPRLPALYGYLMACTDLGYWAQPDEAVAAAKEAGLAQGGSSQLQPEEDDAPQEDSEHVQQERGGRLRVVARGAMFPILVHEMIKGMMEVVSLNALPADDNVRQKVIQKADRMQNETFALLLGPALWRQYLDMLEMDNQELAINLLDKINSLPTAEWHRVMKEIQGGTPEGKRLVKQMVGEIKHDLEAEDRDDYYRKESAKVIVRDLLDE
jgi:hypothetical protein